MRRPPKGEVWVHVERLDREDGKVWAVQYRGPKGGARYDTVSAVLLQAHGYTHFFGAGAEQPKAVIVVPGGRVRFRDGTAVITAVDAKG